MKKEKELDIIKYDNVIMSWSCIGDFMLVSQAFNNLIKSGQVNQAIIITHEESLLGLLEDNQNIILLYPTKKISDFLKLIVLSTKRNIFILQDMPSYNLLSKQIRVIMATFLTRLPRSKFVLLLDKRFEEDLTTKISQRISDNYYAFDTSVHKHISQYMLDILSDLKITYETICDYSLKIISKSYEIATIENSIILHPFASHASKSMDKVWWSELVRLIQEKYSNKIIIIGGKKDFEDSEYISNNNKDILNLAGKVDLTNSLYLVKNCKFIFCSESGPSNYAAFYKKNQIVLWFTKNTDAYYMTFNKNADFIFDNKKSYSGEYAYTKKDTFEKATPLMCFQVFEQKIKAK